MSINCIFIKHDKTYLEMENEELIAFVFLICFHNSYCCDRYDTLFCIIPYDVDSQGINNISRIIVV